MDIIRKTPKRWCEKTDIKKYAERQAQSCVYLDRLFSTIKERCTYAKAITAGTLDTLDHVHKRQKRDLEEVLEIGYPGNRRSYYFDTLYKGSGLDIDDLPESIDKGRLLDILAIQAISYMRGADRYRLLRGFESEDNDVRLREVWGRFYKDARSNSRFIMDILDNLYSREKICVKLSETLIAEDIMMKDILTQKGIDTRSGLTAIVFGDASLGKAIRREGIGVLQVGEDISLSSGMRIIGAADPDILVSRDYAGYQYISEAMKRKRYFFVSMNSGGRDIGQKEIDEAYKKGIRHRANLGVLLDEESVIITQEKGTIYRNRNDLSESLARIIRQRCPTKHYRTRLTTTKDIRSYDPEAYASFSADVRRFYDQGMFIPYYEGAGMHFGFLAERLDGDRFMITARGSDKKDFISGEAAIVCSVDESQRTIDVLSEGKKASLNANVAAGIFSRFPEVNYILHSHIDLPFNKRTETDYPPGTLEDLEEVMKGMGDDYSPLRLRNHGVIISGRDIEEIIESINEAKA